jgi:hypothetical protein
MYRVGFDPQKKSNYGQDYGFGHNYGFGKTDGFKHDYGQKVGFRRQPAQQSTQARDVTQGTGFGRNPFSGGQEYMPNLYGQGVHPFVNPAPQFRDLSERLRYLFPDVTE